MHSEIRYANQVDELPLKTFFARFSLAQSSPILRRSPRLFDVTKDSVKKYGFSVQKIVH